MANFRPGAPKYFLQLPLSLFANSEYNNIMLKPQDIVIVLKLVAKDAAWAPSINQNMLSHQPSPNWSFPILAKELFMSSSEVHAGFKRAVKSQLINPQSRKPNIEALSEFLIHGIRYVFPPERGEMTRGTPTAHAASCLESILIENDKTSPVWPYSEGKSWGQSFLPLYKSVPKAAELDPHLYEMLVLVDAIRGGRARERKLAIQKLQIRLGANEN